MRVLPFAAIAFLLILLQSAPAASAAAGAWTSGGPSERVTAVTLQPTNDTTLLAAGTSGVWQTTDGGASWSRISTTLLGQSLAYDPLDPDVAYANSADAKHVLKTTDNGASWTSVFSLGTVGQIESVLPDPNVPDRVFASGTGTDNLAAVFRSLDGGATWSNVLPADLNGAGGLSTPLAAPLAATMSTPNLILSGVTYYHAGGVVGSPDGGNSWTRVYNGNFTPLAGASSLAAGSSIYAGMNVLEFGALVRSDDNGTNWVDLTAQLPISGPSGGYVQAIALDANNPAAVYIAEWDTASPADTGVFASADRGQTWREIGHLEPRVSGPDGLVFAAGTQTLHAATDSGVYEFTLGTGGPSK